MTPSAILNHLRDHLADHAQRRGGKLALAVSVSQGIAQTQDLLVLSPRGFLVLLFWGGDTITGDTDAGVSTQRLHVIIAHNRGLPARPGDNLTQTRDGQSSLLDLVNEFRAACRACRFPDTITAVELEYKGCETVPVEGMALDAYQLNFELLAQIPEAP